MPLMAVPQTAQSAVEFGGPSSVEYWIVRVRFWVPFTNSASPVTSSPNCRDVQGQLIAVVQIILENCSSLPLSSL